MTTPSPVDARTSPGPINCNVRQRFQQPTDAIPQSCARCGLGPCPFFNADGSAKPLDISTSLVDVSSLEKVATNLQLWWLTQKHETLSRDDAACLALSGFSAIASHNTEADALRETLLRQAAELLRDPECTLTARIIAAENIAAALKQEPKA